jgi:hypothetical protein
MQCIFLSVEKIIVDYMKHKVKYLILIVISLGWIRNVSNVFETPVWSLRDEIQHFDYINCLSDGYLPKAEHAISSYSDHLIDSLPPTWPDSMLTANGFGRKSYEANQPPLYYALLAAPNLLLKKFHVNPMIQIHTLRLLSLLMVLGAVLVLLYTANNLFVWSPFLAYTTLLAAGIMTLVAHGSYTTLGNDLLSPLFGVVLFHLFIQSFRAMNGMKYLFLIVALASLATSFVKVSNALLFIPCTLLIRYRWNSLTKKHSILLIALFLLFPIIKYSLFHNSIVTNQQFSFVGFQNIWWFFRFFFASMLGLPIVYAAWVGVTLNLLLIFSLFYIFRKQQTNIESIVIEISLLTTLFVVLSAIFLNYAIHGVHWSLFRHYGATYPFVIIGFSAVWFIIQKNICKSQKI